MLLGASGELQRYLWIAASHSHDFELNDLLVNVVAAAAGVVIDYGRDARFGAPEPSRWPPAIEAGVIVTLRVLIGAGFASERLRLAPASAIAPRRSAQDADDRWTPCR